MSVLSHQPTGAPAHEAPSWWQLVPTELWASLAISIMWLAVTLDAIFGPNIVNTSAGGDSSSVPSAVVVALFAFLGTWVVARNGLRPRRDD
jgi:hypothetical protein